MNNWKKLLSRAPHRGFTLIEMLVSVLIFSFVMIGMLYMFDRGRWLYFHSEKRTNLQENGRITLEDIERNLRMAGVGIPKGTRIDTTSALPNQTFLPYIIFAAENRIGFRGDVDNRNTMFTADAAAGATTISVQNPTIGCPTNIIVSQRALGWEPFTCSNPTATTITIDPGIPAGETFLASECEVFSPEHVFYRLTPDTDANGVCDVTDDYNQCIVEKCELTDNTPQADDANCSYTVIGTNAAELHFDYMDSAGVTTGTLKDIDRVRVTLIVRDRADRVGQFQDLDFVSEVFIRKQGY